MRKVIKLTESDLKKLIGNIVSEQSTMDMNEYSEGFMNKIINKFKQELTSEVEIYVNRFKEISKNLENRDISTYSFEQLKQTVDSYMNRFERDRLQGFEKEMEKEVGRSYGGANKGAQDRYRDYLTTRDADQLNYMKQSSFKERLGEQSTLPDKFIPGVKTKWGIYLETFGRTSTKHIKMKDGDYSLNWGSHSGSGFDWGMSISKRGTFAFQTTNKEKKAIVEGLIKQYSIPFRSGEYQGNYSIHSGGDQKIYDVSENNMVGFLKKILGNFK